MKIKLDRYKVFCKKRQREFDVLVFEPPKYMWAFDNYPELDIFMIDGDCAAFKVLKYAYAILAQDPSKIIYFPIKNQPIGNYYVGTGDLVLVRPELQFRYSDWKSIWSKLDKKHRSGTYTYNYDKQKLLDCVEVLEKEWHHRDREKREQKIYTEKIVGDTVFMTVPRCWCYENHRSIVKMLGQKTDKYHGTWSQGWYVPYHIIKESIKEGKENVLADKI